MRCPRYSEQAHLLLRTISQYAIQTYNEPIYNTHLEQPTSVFQVLSVLVASRNIALWRKVIAYPLLHFLRGIYHLDTQVQAAAADGMAAIRVWDLKLAQAWVKARYLESTDDYFWLTMEDIERCIAAEQDGGLNLKPAVQAQREAFQTYAEIHPPHSLKDSDIPSLVLDDSKSDEILTGTLMGLPVSPGQIQGKVRILEDTDTPEQVEAGAILVARSTDPELLPFFSGASGLIVEIGGMLSHGSIIAREYGIPAVSGIVDARKRLKSGDRILLDGSTGVVQILESGD